MSVRPKKGLGQHFLAEPSVVHRIVDAVDAPPEAQVVEIGPGEGAMTGLLLARYPSLIALEIDPEAIAHLRQRLPDLDLRESDVLDVNWGALAREGLGTGDRGRGGKAGASGARGSDKPPLPDGRGRGRVTGVGTEAQTGANPPEASGANVPHPVPLPEGEGTSHESSGLASGARGERGDGHEKPGTGNSELGTRDARGEPSANPQSPEPSPRLHVVGNLPYYISSPILFALLDAREHVARAVVMVQKEVADRLVAPEGSKTYGTLSVYFSLLARAELLFGVPPQAFRPPPKVDSAVIAIDFSDPPEPGLDSASLRRVVRAAFGQRRKMMRNSLKSLAVDTGREIPDWAATLRPEQVSPADFVRLTHAFFSP